MFHVKQPDDLQRLVSFLHTENINISTQQIKLLETFLSELKLFATKHRIVSTNDVDHIVSRHFLSSFYFVKQISKTLTINDNILDLGSGAGFPGIILSIVFPNKIVMVDSIRKKTLFLSRIVKKLNLNCEIINERIETFSKREKRLFKIITARALASMSDLVDLASPFLLTGELHTIKGMDFKKEFSGRENEINLTYHTIDKNWISYTQYLDNKIYISFSAKKQA